jgi:predicted nucleotidyltransferase component of viral defense system
MLNLKQIKSFYSKDLENKPRHLLREYLQYKILEIIYNSNFGSRLVFLGGTALRIVYSVPRFSEDLDFDNLGLSKEEFSNLSDLIKKELAKQGLKVEIKLTFKEAFRCYIKIPKLLNSFGLSSLPDEKIVIQVDAYPQRFDFSPNIFNLDKFDVYEKIKVTPIEVILSQKIHTVLGRKRKKGRDFFDVDFLINNKNISPDFKYLKEKLNIENQKELKNKLKKELKEIDFEEMASKDKVFLFNPSHSERIKSFYIGIDNWDFK